MRVAKRTHEATLWDRGYGAVNSKGEGGRNRCV